MTAIRFLINTTSEKTYKFLPTCKLLENFLELFGTLEDSIEFSETFRSSWEFDFRNRSCKILLVTTIRNLVVTTSRNLWFNINLWFFRKLPGTRWKSWELYWTLSNSKKLIRNLILELEVIRFYLWWPFRIWLILLQEIYYLASSCNFLENS